MRVTRAGRKNGWLPSSVKPRISMRSRSAFFVAVLARAPPDAIAATLTAASSAAATVAAATISAATCTTVSVAVLPSTRVRCCSSSSYISSKLWVRCVLL